jgi:DNA/RNA-binding protein KIN17
MLVVGEDPKKHINQYSDEFLKDFLQLLKTGHGEKQVQINQFYQEYIANKEHIHMNATKWPSLTEFAKHLGREGMCRVEENEKGFHITWIDNSPDALRRQEALRRKEAQDQGDEEIEQRMIREQIKRAEQAAGKRDGEAEEQEGRELKRQDGEKIKLSFGAKLKPEEAQKPAEEKPEVSKNADKGEQADFDVPTEQPKPVASKGGFGGISLKLGDKPQTKNVFAQAKKNALASGSKKGSLIQQPKKMSEAERIMKGEMERKRPSGSVGFGMPSGKKQRNH